RKQDLLNFDRLLFYSLYFPQIPPCLSFPYSPFPPFPLLSLSLIFLSFLHLFLLIPMMIIVTLMITTHDNV
ncbi:hypothetical protein KSS87_023728, partial [Heliosperma pusillum]